MLSFTQITAGSLLLQLVSGSNFRIYKRDAESDLIPAACVKSCNLAHTGFATCMAATPIGFNASTDIAEDLKYLKCSCTDSIGLYTGSCTRCMSTLAVPAALSNLNTSILVDGSFLSAYNYGCNAYSTVSNVTWTNTTYSNGGGFSGPGATIYAFNATVPVVVVPSSSSSSSTPLTSASGSLSTPVTTGSTTGGGGVVPVIVNSTVLSSPASATSPAAVAKSTSGSVRSVVNLTGLGLVLVAGLVGSTL